MLDELFVGSSKIVAAHPTLVERDEMLSWLRDRNVRPSALPSTPLSQRTWLGRSRRDRLPIVFVMMFLVGLTLSCSKAESSGQKSTSTMVTATAGTEKPGVPDSAKTPPQGDQRLVVYYFHGNARCPTCIKLENLAKSEVETAFAAAIKAGKIEWKTVNIETPGNEHFAQDYKLYTKSVIVSTMRNNRESSWKNLEQIWQLVHEESKYRDYIRKEVAACLTGTCL